MSESSLAGKRILVTRPSQQAADLVTAIEAAGGIPKVFPLLEILPRDPQLVAREEALLPSPEFLVYVSPNAVHHGLRWHRTNAVAIAIGPATLSELHRAGISDARHAGAGFDSESLLADAVFESVAGRHIRIVRGQDGRELLGETLRDRGAVVDYLAVYRRQARQVSDDEATRLQNRLRKGEIDGITIMSVASMQSLVGVLQGSAHDLLRGCRLVTPSRRVLKNINELMPDARATLAPGPQADDMILGLIACLKRDNTE
jgi:uroporphyrinogen-III synthase